MEPRPSVSVEVLMCPTVQITMKSHPHHIPYVCLVRMCCGLRGVRSELGSETESVCSVKTSNRTQIADARCQQSRIVYRTVKPFLAKVVI